MDDGEPAAAGVSSDEPSLRDTVSPKCHRCGEWGHTGENCPHFKRERSNHTDAWTHFDNTPLREADDGSHWILRDAVELKQPGDGHCLFHSLAVGMRSFDVDISGPALRTELAQWLQAHATVTVAGNTFAEWIFHDTSLSLEEYCTDMQCTIQWGGAIELLSLIHI